MNRVFRIIWRVTLILMIQFAFVGCGDDNEGTTSGDGTPWQQKASMTTWQPSSAAAVAGGKIYVLGGTYQGNTEIPVDNVEEYNPVTDQWNARAPMPTPRYWLAAAVAYGKIYAIGGSQYPGTWVSGPQPIQALNTVEEYDPVTNTWSTKSNMPNNRMKHKAIALNGKIYVIGGVLNNAPGPWIAANLVEAYDPLADSWETKTSMPTACEDFAVETAFDKIYVIGGYIRSDFFSYDNYLDTVEEYDPIADSWTTRDSMPTKRLFFATGVIDEDIYVVGGSMADPYDLNEELDLSTDTWNSKSPMPVSGQCTTGIVVSDKLYVIGAGEPQAVFEYDPARDR